VVLTASAERTSSVWGESPLAIGETLQRDLGSLRIEVHREPGELWVRASPHGSDAGDDDWTRWSESSDAMISIRPGLPDRPVVVSPELPFFLPPRETARIYVRIPLVVMISARDVGGIVTHLGEFPTEVLSDTWWGGFTEGTLAYWLETSARRAMSKDLFDPSLAVCPLVLINESDEALPIDQFAVRVAYLTLFGRGPAVWTDEVHVRYRGQQEESEISYSGKIPEVAGDVEKIGSYREHPPRGLRSKMFGRILSRSLGG
jgi:hypothetical protein